MNILLSNDDGINAPGIRALLACLPENANVAIVAPKTERSASGHAISLGQKLRVDIRKVDGRMEYAVHGTPADCIKFALYELSDFSPDLLISGINQGANTGVSVFYSGTISAAREGFINRIPAIAVSLCSKEYRQFEASQKITRKLIEAFEDGAIPKNIMLSVNVPPLDMPAIKGIKITKQASSRFVEEFVAEKNEGEQKVYSLAGEIELFDADGTSDEEAIENGFISITPLKLDMTDYGMIQVFQDWLGRG